LGISKKFALALTSRPARLISLKTSCSRKPSKPSSSFPFCGKPAEKNCKWNQKIHQEKAEKMRKDFKQMIDRKAWTTHHAILVHRKTTF
jgi:hypothetical protein